MKILVIEPGKRPEAHEINGTLASMQENRRRNDRGRLSF